MTRSYAIRQLLRHGPLTHGEIVAVTGWPNGVARGAIRQAMTTKRLDKIQITNIDGRRHYTVAPEQRIN